ncbi:hypothetical protein EZV62_000731 [Acer yangbiense]|uniref:3-ketoacyl-CoA synthase n=1 Tax=Acer yangbiense TaxID=1000413 RepID=A0A5C7IUG9_9ROSI|nr:hypothetical protein EZV62_000731 [Acer yangbiense]
MATTTENKNLPNFFLSVRLKYVKLGYHYLISNAFYMFLVPLLVVVITHLSTLTVDNFIKLQENLKLSFVTTILCSVAFVFTSTIYLMSRPRKVYMVDFACYKPEPARLCTKEYFMDIVQRAGTFTEESIAFKKKILERSGCGQMTYGPEGLMQIPHRRSMSDARKETETVIVGAIDELLAKTGVKPRDIGILVVNSSLFNPTPSLSAMIVNRYKLRGNILSYNLGGMGCSAGLISIDLAKQLLQVYYFSILIFILFFIFYFYDPRSALHRIFMEIKIDSSWKSKLALHGDLIRISDLSMQQVHPNSYALVVSTENITFNWYEGNERSMLVTNCLFRVGGAAILLSNRSSDRRCAKYQLVHTIRTHKGADDNCYNCVMQKEDKDNRSIGVSLSKDLMSVAGDALKTNITTLGPLVLPMSEQLLFFATLVAKKIFKMKIKPYIPDFKLAFEHFCIHAGGRAVLDELEKNLELSEWHMEPSRMTLNRFGNTSSSSLWYELAYSEAKGRIRKGDRTWQIAFGSGFKCNSAVWRALRTINPAKEKNPWIEEIDNFPVHVPKIATIAV